MIAHNDPTSASGIRYELEASEMASGHSVMLLTGPVSGTMAISDGSAYDVTPEVIAVKPEHRDELLRTIHKAHHAAGRFLDVPVPE